MATYVKGSFKYTWKKHCGSESLEGQVLTRPFSAAHRVPLWTHGLLLHSSVYRLIWRAEACPKKEALKQGMALSFQHHWPWRSGTGSWTGTHHVLWGLPNADLCLLLPGFSSVLSDYRSLIFIPQGHQLLLLHITPHAHSRASESLHICIATRFLLHHH